MAIFSLFILSNDCFTNVAEIQRSHKIQSCTTTCGFHHLRFALCYPVISQFRPLCWVNTINNQNGVFVSSFLFQLFVSVSENLLLPFTVFMRYANRFFIIEVIAIQPFIHARHDVTNAPPLLNLQDYRLCGGCRFSVRYAISSVVCASLR